jgi:hypothetical protein
MEIIYAMLAVSVVLIIQNIVTDEKQRRKDKKKFTIAHPIDSLLAGIAEAFFANALILAIFYIQYLKNN